MESYAYHKLKYEINGEIEVKPDRAHFPLIVSARGETYQASLRNATRVLEQLKDALQQENKSHFIISPADFFESDKSLKRMLKVTFFGKDKDEASTNLTLCLTVKFEDKNDFWDRADSVAQALDFLDDFMKAHDRKENIALSREAMFYEVDNKEQFREEIVQIIYSKAKKVADVIGQNEGREPKVREVKFDQNIREDILNFNKALLSIDATMEFSFE